eukprot:g30639.t1
MQYGYNGCKDPDQFPPMQLTVENVRDIHMKGGSILKAGRGGMEDPDRILDQLQKQGVNMLFTVGGDGTQAAASMLFQAAKKRNMPLSIVGVIRNGWVEATSCSKGVGIVKLMGALK